MACQRFPTESVSSSSSYSSMSVLMLSSRASLSSSSQPTKNLGAPRRLSPGLLGSDITVPRGNRQRLAAPSYTNTPPERAADGRARGLGERERSTLPGPDSRAGVWGGWVGLDSIGGGDSNRRGYMTNDGAGQSSGMTLLLKFLILHSGNSHLIWLGWVSNKPSAAWRLKLHLYDDSPFLHLYEKMSPTRGTKHSTLFRMKIFVGYMYLSNKF